MAGDREKPGDAARDAVREVGAVVGGAGRRLARGLRDLTLRPEDEAPSDGEETEAAEGGGEDDDLGRKLRDLGRDFVDVMGSVSAKTGRGLRQAAFDVADSVRGAIDGARDARGNGARPQDGDAPAGDTAPAGDLEDVDEDDD